MSQWQIRRASDADGVGIYHLHTILNRPPRADSITSEYFVALIEESVIGCAAVRRKQDVGYLYGLAVSRDWRRHGIGHALTRERLDWLRNEGASSVYVLAMFWNIHFFKKHGFVLADRGVLKELAHLHGDFIQNWSSRSALLAYRFD